MKLAPRKIANPGEQRRDQRELTFAGATRPAPSSQTRTYYAAARDFLRGARMEPG